MTREVEAALTEFYRVGLICEAASELGCGIRAKPVLEKLEAHESISDAWLDASGSLLAIRWKSQPVEDAGILASAFTGEQCVSAERITDADECRALLNALALGDGWYQAAQVDRLSEEEAAVIAARVVRRVEAKTVLEADLAHRLMMSIAQSCYRVLATEAPGTSESRGERLRQAILDGGRSQLTDEQHGVLQQAVALAGHRPLPNER
jgi:hypothetical protein